MNDINRIMIFILMSALLYALYVYQQKILANISISKPVKQKSIASKSIPELKNKKKKKVTIKESNNKKVVRKKLSADNESIDNVSVGNISQFSLGSLEDLKSEGPYKQDSALGSMGSGMSLLDEDSFFFQ